HIGLGQRVAENMYWAVWPHDIGKKNLPLELWDSDEKPDARLKKLRRTHTLLGAQIANELLPAQYHGHPFHALMVDIMAYHHQQLDGKGTLGIMGDKLSQPVRLASIVEAYDGYSIWRPHFGERDITPEGVLARMREEKGAD